MLATLGAFAAGAQRPAPAKARSTQARGPASASTVVPGEPKPLSARVVAYQIDARLDPEKKSIEANESLTYRNLTGQALQTFPFHLYLNAFQPKSTFMTEVRRGGTRGTGPDAGWDPKHYGAIEVRSIAADGMGDLTSQMQFIQPDDHNSDDRTVAQVTLPKPVPPGASVTFRIAFHDQLPEVVERTGYKRDFFMVGQWFPKVGVWWHGGWNCHQFHSTTEFFADFGTFDVKVTVPRNYILGAGGDEVGREDNPDGTQTVVYHSEDVHDFSWTASPDFTLVDDSWTGSEAPVRIHLLMSPGHLRQTGRYLQSVKGTLGYFDRWYGTYPYDRITVVDPPEGGGDAGGMEYPTLITGGTTWWEPAGLHGIEGVTEHEFGHQYWYGMVATNEFEEAWLDEGINSYTEVKIMDALYGQGRSLIDLWGLTADDAGAQRLSYLDAPDSDPMTRFAYQFMSTAAYGGVTYGKTATVLLTLEGLIGPDTMRNAMHTYFERYKFTHPTGTDFLKTLEDVSGQDLGWYFNQAVSGTNVLDYEVLAVRSDRADWYVQNPPEAKKGQTLYRGTVLIHRKGDFIFPVETEVRFDNGETAHEKWDGRDRWIRYEYLKKAKIVSAEVDPGHKVPLDRDFFNNSQTAEPNSKATRKIATYWMFLEQLSSQVLAWLV
ncbi:MAG TPA: M1 family metallopeptidase [Terriglobia bacterium]|nr:M1 family metallopeptidase [Terriglobia bacterium]